MAAETQDPSNSESTEVRDAAQYEAALARLETLQERLDGLRSIVPSLVAPLMQPATGKAQMFADIKKAALHSTNDIKAFRDDWNSEKTQQVFAKSKESLEKNGDLSKASGVPRYGWSER